MKVTLSIGGQTRSAHVIKRGDVISVSFDDGVEFLVRAERQRDGGMTFRPVERPWDGHVNGQSDRQDSGARRTFLYRDGSERQLWIDGKTIRYRRIEASEVREPSGSGSLSATIPAVVLDVLVSLGETVEEGQTLILLESMKMVMPIVAPHRGSIVALNCGKGDSVAPGSTLVEIAAEPASK